MSLKKSGEIFKTVSYIPPKRCDVIGRGTVFVKKLDGSVTVKVYLEGLKESEN